MGVSSPGRRAAGPGHGRLGRCMPAVSSSRAPEARAPGTAWPCTPPAPGPGSSRAPGVSKGLETRERFQDGCLLNRSSNPAVLKFGYQHIKIDTQRRSRRKDNGMLTSCSSGAVELSALIPSTSVKIFRANFCNTRHDLLKNYQPNLVSGPKRAASESGKWAFLESREPPGDVPSLKRHFLETQE